MVTNNTELEARMQELEKEISAKQQELVTLRKEYRSEVSDYTLAGPDGPVQLSELFGDKRDLILVHNMGKRCSYCTLWADGFNGLYDHLADRAAFVVVSPDAPEVQAEFSEGRGWRFPMYSDQDTSFTRAMGYLQDHDGTGYWYPGYSTFRKNDDGTITRVAKDFFGPGDVYCGIWYMFDLLEDGANNWQPSLSYGNAVAAA